MPRAGLDAATVTAAGADLADDLGFEQLSMGLVAERLGVRTPSLYKHVQNLADLAQRIAVLAAVELGDALRDALQGLSGRDALHAAARTFRGYVVAHPGRYAATLGARPTGPDDAYAAATARVLESLAVVLRGYGVAAHEEVHALRMVRSALHGFATLEAGGGFQFSTDVDDSFTWAVEFVDRGLRSGAVT
ncbi:TetR/AcrR family transcriptional regulator [Kineococcus rhizosphaerae]|uniref:TetR family transcriptional regulator n=1 Tax=Kineococcus rhizosphaerae TaxID=559628 RepID=A0A2T0R6W1_9ACTN|nr:TetR/AcrR family transcriptional regulator [Kineococcus rhizosphaerae]PRY16904.1 TetR family transcriptional regulator [Kineococcus rhizosphaerae]